MTLTFTTALLVRRGSVYEAKVEAAGVAQDLGGATATASLVRVGTGEETPDLTAELIAGEAGALTVSLAAGQLGPELRPGRYSLRFEVHLQDGGVLAIPPDDSLQITLT